MLCGVDDGWYFWLNLVQLAKMRGSVSLEKTSVKFLCVSGWQGQQVHQGRGTELSHMLDSEKHECNYVCSFASMLMRCHIYSYLCAYALH